MAVGFGHDPPPQAVYFWADEKNNCHLAGVMGEVARKYLNEWV
jgi:hypothetical protein